MHSITIHFSSFFFLNIKKDLQNFLDAKIAKFSYLWCSTMHGSHPRDQSSTNNHSNSIYKLEYKVAANKIKITMN